MSAKLPAPSLTVPLIVGAGVGVLALGLLWYVKSKIPAAAQAVNPLNDNNVFSQAANATVQKVTGDPNATLGAKIFEWLNPSGVAAEKALSAPITPPASGGGGW